LAVGIESITHLISLATLKSTRPYPVTQWLFSSQPEGKPAKPRWYLPFKEWQLHSSGTGSSSRPF